MVVLVTSAVLILVLATVAYSFANRSLTSSGPVADGPTFYLALRSTNVSAAATSGGPWNLEQVYGVASPIAVDPSSWGWGEYDQTLASCQVAFDGLTIWNGTLPLFNGTFDSGTAPFWQMVYFSNASQQLLVAIDVLGVVHAYPPIALTSECAVKSGLAYEPWLGISVWNRAGFPSDSPVTAMNAWNFGAGKFVDWLGTTPAEMYLYGGNQFGSGQLLGDQIQYFTCGTNAAVGRTQGLAVFQAADQSSFAGNSNNYSLGCTPTTNSWTAISLKMTFTTTLVEHGTSTTILRQAFQFNMTGPLPFVGPGYNLRGLTSWMISLNLTNHSGDRLSIGGSGCGSWVPSLKDCVETSGWYAVLLGPDGTWEGSYGATHLGQGWTYPVLPIANNESIAMIVPSSWNVTGDTLEVTSTTSELPLTGSVMFA